MQTIPLLMLRLIVDLSDVYGFSIGGIDRALHAFHEMRPLIPSLLPFTMSWCMLHGIVGNVEEHYSPCTVRFVLSPPLLLCGLVLAV